MPTQPKVSFTLLKTLLLYAEKIGVDLSVAGQDAGDKPESRARLPAGQFYTLWSAVENQAGDPDFGLHLVETSQTHWGSGLLAAVMLNCPTIGAAMERLCRYHALTTDVIQVQQRREGPLVTFIIHSPFPDGLFDRQVAEAACSQVFFTLKNLSGGKLSFKEVHFRHPKPARTHEHQRVFRVPVRFDAAEDAILLDRGSLDAPIPLADPNILQPLETLVQSLLVELYPPESWSDRVTCSIGESLLRGEKPSLSVIAAGFATSPRQLQKMLKKEETTYRTLFDQVRKEIALDCLTKPGMTLYDVVFLLGFSDQSSFNHAFKRWTGRSPGEYRTAAK